MSIANGEILTYLGTWNANGGFQTVGDLISAVSTDMMQQGLAVRSSNNSALDNLKLLYGGSIKVSLVIQVENGLGYGSLTDVISIVRNAVYQETGSFPDEDSIPYGGLDGRTPTGQPGDSSGRGGGGDKTGCIAGTNHDLSDTFSLSCWFSNLTTQGLSTVGMLVLVAIVGLILLSKAERVAS